MEVERRLLYPPTMIVVHSKERRAKCTVEALRGRTGFQFTSYPLRQPVDLPGYVRLALDGPQLDDADRGSGLLLLDATWKLAEGMQRDFAHVPPRSLPAWATAYPRTSKLYRDPAPGLATIEALYVAYVLLERPLDGLLDAYRWKAEFLALNRAPRTGAH